MKKISIYIFIITLSIIESASYASQWVELCNNVYYDVELLHSEGEETVFWLKSIEPKYTLRQQIRLDSQNKKYCVIQSYMYDTKGKLLDVEKTQTPYYRIIPDSVSEVF